jgi:hypothetical protein
MDGTESSNESGRHWLHPEPGSRLPESNRGPSLYGSDALPAELSRREDGSYPGMLAPSRDAP